ncbi:hypothetical protein SAMN04488595_101240 [Ralstonia sp. 25mfcol4.1]|uniref:hypothetical protein n=1 Tax=Ralstonia sp. 25mfcol4.1 TaxID=1761899 RepID=UPI00088D6782|nr:hypothetical protein [Ralstonia sp. 25mfcol4.1]SDO61844.1 hypothetical protein SAMN04488595_101240 [Ralstonia sp. 25mfcol4.1]
MMENDTSLNDPNQWIQGELAWETFCKCHPHFGFTGSLRSWEAFRRRHVQTLIDKGVMRRAGRAYIAHKHSFNAAAFACVTLPSTLNNDTTKAA